MIGEKILNYRVESLIGEGGVGSVYLATHIQLGREVAIKVLNPMLVNNEEVKERFRNEAATLSSLQHLNIITLYDYLEEDRGLFLIMEYAHGRSLDDYIRQVSGPIPEEKALFFFNQILDGVAYAHSQGIVHRDLKPSNIIITQDADVKVLDFGIAKILKSNHQMTKTGARLGTVLYMSPEQVKGQAVDKRSDIYSLGVTFFQMLTGKSPYDDENSTEFEIFNKIVNDPLPPAKTFYPGVSDRMQAIIDKATSKDPNDRFQTCEVFKQALLEPSFTPKASINESVRGNTDTKVHTRTSEERAKRRKRRSSNNANMILYIVLGLVLSVMIYFVASEFMFSESSNNNEEIVENDDSNEEEDVINLSEEEEDYEEEEEDTEEEDSNPELDSLKKNEAKTKDLIKLFQKDRIVMLRKQLIVDGQVLEQEFGEMKLQVSIINQSKEADFEDITVRIVFYDEAGKEVKIREQELEPLSAGKAIQFKVTQAAETFKCELKSAKPIDLNPSPTLDSLNTVLEDIRDRMAEIKEESLEEE